MAQALCLKESEKTALSEKLMGTRHSLATISLDMERQKRDAQSRQEQDRVGLRLQGGLWSRSALSPPRYPASHLASSIPPGGLLFLSLLLLWVFYPGVP
ncbi:hypothetical protein CR201_G0055712 [Pongo abelii]|uniref:Uncharacterized protein n=1 Tax=Pongo abelii TaxID=9601 RepID=A0A2J8QZC5_PONAB|nr:hypothetical protein CR201_G0055712 [Pongo abelii]